jgi:hypothetical protein
MKILPSHTPGARRAATVLGLVLSLAAHADDEENHEKKEPFAFDDFTRLTGNPRTT